MGYMYFTDLPRRLAEELLCDSSQVHQLPSSGINPRS